MKALISPKEIQDITYVSEWVEVAGIWEPVELTIENCQRVAEVEPDDEIFEVASPLFWMGCPDDCTADEWYYKDSQVHKNPVDAPEPEPEVNEFLLP